MRSCLLMLVALAAFLLLVALLPAMALAQGLTAVEGKLTNGTAGAPPPAGVEVTLHVVQSTASVETNVGVTDEAGAFRIEVPMVDNVTSYVISLSYEGAVYGRALDLGELSEPADITVYESTSDLSVLEVNSAALVLRSQPDTEGMLRGSEVVSLVNTSDRTFIPDLTGPAMGQMNFMRFSLPPGATNLRLESDLAGGDIIDVGPGFAVTASVPPGDHLVGFSYSAPYDGDSLEFTRTAHMATADFHLLLPEDLGQVQSDALRVGDDRVLFGDDLFQAWRAGPLQAAEKVRMEFSGLPEPPWHQRLRETLLEGPGPQLFLASLLGLALVGALLYSLLRSVPSSRPALTTAAAGIVSSPQAQDCLRQLAELDDGLEQGEVAPEDYHDRREALRADLLQAWASEGSR